MPAIRHTSDPSTDQADTPGTERAPWWRRLPPIVALLLLAPWAAECSWGGFTVVDYPGVLIILAPMYGGAAVLIREVARRTGGGWPAIVLLAGAFGVIQAGLVDQSLFNLGYLEDTEFADLVEANGRTVVPGLGFDAGQAIDFVGNHIALSICAPIALVESFLPPHRRNRPWLGGPGLLAVGVLYVLGSLLIFSDDGGRKGFLASPAQVTFASVVTLVLVGAALLPRRRPVARPGRPPRPVVVGLAALGPHAVGYLVYGTGWLSVVIRLAAAGVLAVLLMRWSRRAGWGHRHVLAACAAGLAQAAVTAYLVPPYAPASPTVALVSDIAVSVITVTLVVAAFRRLRPADGKPAADPTDPAPADVPATPDQRAS
ncbi:hypothetical protein [Plantactinospora sp. GCM10030261]|uniref:hypothetical protein n=1 Tax=Plantactinospora sp. GCM10030261 TaxID=3273420 RepID=UPI0036233DA8